MTLLTLCQMRDEPSSRAACQCEFCPHLILFAWVVARLYRCAQPFFAGVGLLPYGIGTSNNDNVGIVLGDELLHFNVRLRHALSRREQTPACTAVSLHVELV